MSRGQQLEVIYTNKKTTDCLYVSLPIPFFAGLLLLLLLLLSVAQLAVRKFTGGKCQDGRHINKYVYVFNQQSQLGFIIN